MNYAVGKVVKSMDRFKLRSVYTKTTRKILLPLSLGLCSSTLLHILSQVLETSVKKVGRAGFELHVLFIDASRVVSSDIKSDLFPLLKEIYTQPHYHLRHFEEVLSMGLDLHGESLLPAQSLLETTSGTSDRSPAEQLRELLSSLPSASSKTDIITVLRTRLIAEVAKELGCEAITWGDSTTKLAERILAETAKGRGASLPSLTSDGLSTNGLLYVFPMRELFRKEVHNYAMFMTPSLPSLITDMATQENASVPASSKNTTIDALMGRYFASVEVNYPSVVANVVRTSSKLNPPETPTFSAVCEICNVPVSEGTDGVDDPAEGTPRSAEGDRKIRCYGCVRSLLGMKIAPSTPG